jgi:hypothetical protein
MGTPYLKSVFFPGLLLSVLLVLDSWILLGTIPSSALDFILPVAFLSIVLGTALEALDPILYEILKGECLPISLRTLLLSGQQQKVDRWKERIRNLRNANARNGELAKLEGSLRQYPLTDPDAELYLDRFGPTSPTNFGNLLLAAEEYSWNKYGMDLPTFWAALQSLLTKEESDLLEDQRSDLDMFIYSLSGLTLHLLTVVLISVVLYSLKSPTILRLLAPVELTVSLLGQQDFVLAIPRLLAWDLLCLSYTFVGVCLVYYWLIVNSALPSYCETLKSLVDITQEKLAENYSFIVRTPIRTLEQRRLFWKAVRDYVAFHDQP